MSDSDLPPFAQASAGALGSVVSNTLVYPLDLLSTRLQTQTGKRDGKKAPRVSMVAALQEIFHTRGLAGLYQGWGADSLSNTLSNFLFFFFRGFLIDLLHERKARLAGPSSGTKGKATSQPLTAAEDLAAGALAGVASRFFTTPLSNVTVRKQTSATGVGRKDDGSEKNGDESSDEEDGTYSDEPGIVDILKEIVKDKGALGLWSGFPTAVLLSITPALTFFWTNVFTSLLLPRSVRDNPNALQTFLTSAAGNAASTIILFPLMLSKTRLQWKSPSGRKVYKGLADVVGKTVRKNGVAGMYQGLESQLVKGIVGHGVTMMVKQRVEAGFVAAYLILRNRARQSHVA